jgi:hypothetical protein
MRGLPPAWLLALCLALFLVTNVLNAVYAN